MNRWLVVSILVVSSGAGAAALAILNPPTSDRISGDAVVVHAGGRGDRLEAGLLLVDSGAATTLVILNGAHEGWSEANALCGQSEPYIVLCPEASPENTVGEARALGELVEEEGWQTVVVVTSDYHLRRASILDRRCAGDTTEIRPVASLSDIGFGRRLFLLGREMFALPQAYTTGC